MFDSVSVRVCTKIIRDYSTFVVNHNFKVRSSATYVFAAKTICRDKDIFNNDYISLADLSWYTYN
jgi:hypothetical protein